MNFITEDLLTNLILRISPEEIQKLIDKNIDIASYIKKKYSGFLAFVYGFLIKNPGVLKELKSITKEDLFNIAQKNPRLSKILQTQKGKEWFNKQDLNIFRL